MSWRRNRALYERNRPLSERNRSITRGESGSWKAFVAFVSRSQSGVKLPTGPSDTVHRSSGTLLDCAYRGKRVPFVLIKGKLKLSPRFGFEEELLK